MIRIIYAAHFFGVDAAHDGKLEQVFGFAVGIGANVQHDAGAAGGGKDRCETGAVHARDGTQSKVCGHGRRAGIAGCNECVRLAVFNQVNTNSH